MDEREPFTQEIRWFIMTDLQPSASDSQCLEIISGYQFQDRPEWKVQPPDRRSMKSRWTLLGVRGTVVLSPEGINCMMAGTPSALKLFQQDLAECLEYRNLIFHRHRCSLWPFHRLLVKFKPQIIRLGLSERFRQAVPYLEPRQLQQWLAEGKPLILLDTRNAYEIQVGGFRNARNLRAQSYRELGAALENIDFPPNVPVVTYCTGGIRCEKAAARLVERGVSEVYQLQGGILNYFREAGDYGYEGDCFVFDWRGAVNARLEPVARGARCQGGRHQILAGAGIEPSSERTNH